MRNRNRCRTRSQSGLNLKYRSGQFPTESKDLHLVGFQRYCTTTVPSAAFCSYWTQVFP